MKILFDHGTPAPLRHHLRKHLVDLAEGKGWETLGNGELIRRAEEIRIAIERITAGRSNGSANLTALY
ncbi:MAG: hypothetical protein OXE56_02185 [Gammaproteobacteria bacterium]|nr:hypothetical protein [Gammaproteobacteria bacterium]